MVRLDRIGKAFRRRGAEPLEVLREISFDVRPESITALLGASGCGKSTLLNIVSGLIEADSGHVRLDGTPLAKFDDWRSLGYLFQEDRLLPWRTALDNVAFGLEATPMPKAERRERALEALALVELQGFANNYPFELSGGMRSRVALARSLVTRPKILLMDEPFSKLDPAIRSQMHGELLRIARMKAMTIIFVTHDVEEAVVLADQIVLLMPRPGRVREIVPMPLSYPRDPAGLEVAQQVRALRGRI
ncbi:MAG: ABC transporter ATP-binding protein [Pseudomonadota bacterium]|nr:ABC transporter ATP-binding protein [Pseudomonadota bacterium]